MAHHTELGAKGEKIAIEYLQKKGYEILRTNFRFQKAEIDIICKNGDSVVAVEVKTRSTADFGDPQDFLKPKQIQRLVMAMDEYVRKYDMDQEVRFDIIAIVVNRDKIEIEHLEDAFFPF